MTDAVLGSFMQRVGRDGEETREISFSNRSYQEWLLTAICSLKMLLVLIMKQRYAHVYLRKTTNLIVLSFHTRCKLQPCYFVKQLHAMSRETYPPYMLQFLKPQLPGVTPDGNCRFEK